MTFTPDSGGRKNTVKRPSSVGEHSLEAARPPSASVLLPRQPIGKLLWARRLCKASSPAHLFSKGSGYVPRHHLPGAREGTAVTFAIFF